LAADTSDPLASYTPWLTRLLEPDGRHWQEDLPFTFDPPAGWSEAPRLARALTLLDSWAQADHTFIPWLSFPATLRRLGICENTLPCLVIGDPAQRFATTHRADLLKRLLKVLRTAADDGVKRLAALEDVTRRTAAALLTQRRPGKLPRLAKLALARPCLAARQVAPLLKVSISGAGKLLDRAARTGIVVEISGRTSWRSYIAPDLAQALGLTKPSLGRPFLAPPPSPELDSILASYDADMALLDAELQRLGVETKPRSNLDHSS